MNATLQLEQLETRLSALSDSYNTLQTNTDAFFLIVISLIIFFMQCGFAFVECGAVRSKNATNILTKNLLDSSVAGVAYWLVGYAFAFGKGNNFIGYKFFAFYELPPSSYPHWFFQFVFAATAATIVSGAMAERCEFAAYLVYSFMLTGFVYPIVTHWAWSSEGWLATGISFTENNSTTTVTYQDFAGSGVVHLLGATTALVGAYFLGPRIGKFDDFGAADNIKGHSVPLSALGGFILIFGFFAFNGGSQGSITQPGDAEAICNAIISTVISGTFAAFTTLILNRIPAIGGLESSWSLLITLNGCLTGMVAVCAGCNVLSAWASAIVGVFSSLMYIYTARFVEWLKVDDPLNVVAVHGGGGILGVIIAPIFANDVGVIFTWNKQAGLQLAWNLAGMTAIIAWSGAIAITMFVILKYTKLLRVDEEWEMKGLDIPKHGEDAYPKEAYGHGWENKGDCLKNLLKSTMDGKGQWLKFFEVLEKLRAERENPNGDIPNMNPSKSPNSNDSTVCLVPMYPSVNGSVDGYTNNGFVDSTHL